MQPEFPLPSFYPGPPTLSNLSLFGTFGGHLVIHFDLNKTLIANDKAGGKPSTKDVIQELLAEKTNSLWNETCKEPISYSQYVKEHLYPGDEQNPEIRAKRIALLHKFVDTCDITEVREEYEKTVKALGNQFVFASFFELLKVLKVHNIATTIILRTFGHELIDVATGIRRELREADFVHGSFRKGVLSLDGEPTKTPFCRDWEQLFLKYRWIAIQDDFETWREANYSPSAGKPFPLFSDNTRVHTLFFDDSIETEKLLPKNIVSPIGKTSMKDLVKNGQLVKVDTLQAIRDPYYFVRKVEESLLRQDSKQYDPRQKFFKGLAESPPSSPEKTPNISRAPSPGPDDGMLFPMDEEDFSTPIDGEEFFSPLAIEKGHG